MSEWAGVGAEPGGGETAAIQAAYELSAREARETVAVAARLGTHPYNLANLIYFESGWRPDARNPRSDASGLIQFMPATAKELRTTTAQIRGMSRLQQLPLVERYLSPYRGRLGSAEALYMAVFYPLAMRWPPGKEFSASVQKSNPGIKTPSDYVRLANRRAKLPVVRNGGSPAPVPVTGSGQGSGMGWGWMAVGGLLVTGALVAGRAVMLRRRAAR